MIRQPAVAGTFYPANKELLGEMIDGFFKDAVDEELEGDVKAIIVPHAGYIYSGIVAASGYKLLQKLDQKKKWKVVLLGPSHFEPFYNAATPESDEWKFPFGNVKVKNIHDELPDKVDESMIKPFEKAFTREHSLEVQVPFLQKSLANFTLYPLCLGDFNAETLADEIEEFIKQDDVILVVSSDLSHYYSYEEAKMLDQNANMFIPKINIQGVIDRVEACGMKGILTCLFLAKKFGWKGEMIDYQNSGDTAGDKSQVVGYGCYAFTK